MSEFRLVVLLILSSMFTVALIDIVIINGVFK